ncbi:MAG: LysR family transcriptional regulator [Clostridia bacterium]|nr:LysR family transcriptional regulator [Clostridia bacterium]
MDTALQRYTAFLKTVELEIFSKAADALQYSQPAVSRMIKGLEDEYGVALLRRSSKKVCLTAEGEALLPYIMDICQTTRLMQERVNALGDLKNGTLRIGVLTNISTHWLPGVIQRFHQDYPAINYEMLDGDGHSIQTWIAEGRIDCGILPLPIHDKLDTVPLFSETFFAVLPTNHPLCRRDMLSVSNFADMPFILPEKGGNTTISDYLSEHGIKPDIRLVTWEDYTVLRMVESGVGASILSETILANTQADIIAKPLDPPLHRDIVFAAKNIKSAPPLVRRFMDYLG